ncbi:DUF3413 domain-containing protein [Neptunicella marina]|uniref:DUF3413 domain-containing protein n=1 Tax=Neptunicella marina TaxID=2125989 RepID=A0A8J6IRW7_9ALTE|nr:DUF3413 domain-containing protein [Neptunicella marina]MBC3764607.1 DUF3413 domain-containing protein [Neptunicella marina]
MILTETPRRQRVTKLVGWGHWFAFFNILIAIVIASIYTFNSRLPDTALGAVYLFSNWFGHISFLTFIGFVILILPLCYLLPNVKVVKAIASVVAAVGLALLAFDALVYTKYGLHVSFSSAELLRNETRNVIANFGWQQWGFFALLFIVWLSFQLILANALWKRTERFKLRKYAQPLALFFIACFVTSHATHIWADANLYQPIVEQDDMFPLSYPATAKTLMSKYDLLDRDSYEQRKQLQLERRIQGVNYPTSALYCSINPQSNVNLLVLNHGDIDALVAELPVSKINNYYDLSSSAVAGQFSLLYGLPEMYQHVMYPITPVLLDLPAKLGLETYVYAPGFKYGNSSWDAFKQQFAQHSARLAIAFVSPEQAQELLSHFDFSAGQIVITGLQSDSQVSTYSNLQGVDQVSVAGHEDIAPTLLNAMGCSTNTELYSTGQNLMQLKRDWMVTSLGDKIVLLNPTRRIEVDSNGNHKIFDRQTGAELSEDLNTSVLSQGIKHLSRFIAK